MSDDDFDDVYRSAVKTGIENLEILQAAAAWCENIDVTKGPLGTGLLEAATGLPISGGSLRCEHARAPRTFGMALVHSAVEFYERNCVGCTHRKPTEATAHLGTWADQVIADRLQRERNAEDARLKANVAREARRADRRLRFGAPSPTVQSLLDLIDRVDGEGGDTEAEALLNRHAEMSPQDFPDELLKSLTDQAIAIGNAALLETVVAVFERDGRPGTERMLNIAFGALSIGVAMEACGSVVAAHASKSCDSDEALAAIVVLAAGRVDSFEPRRTDARPAALLRLYDVDPDRIIRFINAALRDADVQDRAIAGHAAEKLAFARQTSRSGLLPALLDAIALPDRSRYAGDAFGNAQAQEVVAAMIVAEPEATSDELDRRIDSADADYLRSLWRCYDRVVRSRHREPLAPLVASVIGGRAIALLSKGNLNMHAAREVAETLSMLCQFHGDTAGVDTSQLVDLLLLSETSLEGFDSSAAEPGADAAQGDDQFLRNMQRFSDRTVLASVSGLLQGALEGLARRNAAGFIEALHSGVWARLATASAVRGSLLEVLGEIISTQEEFNLASSLLRTAIENGDAVAERAAGLKALAEMRYDGLNYPEWVAPAVLTALADDYLAVVIAAIRALPRIQVPLPQRPAVINRLLQFASAYGPDRIRSDDVESALRSVLRLAKGQAYEAKANELALQVIRQFPSAEAIEMLDELQLDSRHPDWPKTAIEALKRDPNPSWADLRQYEREETLRELTTIQTDALAPYFDALADIALDRIADRPWVWAVSDVLAGHGEFGRAAALCDAVVTNLPDTREHRPARRYARQIALCHHIDAAVVAADDEMTMRLLDEFLLLAAEPEDE